MRCKSGTAKGIVVGLLGLIAAACSNDAGVITSPTGGGPVTKSISSSAAGSDLSAVPRFAITLQAVGPFEPGRPIQINAQIAAKVGTQHAQFAITMPEVEAARRNNFASMGSLRDFHAPSLRAVSQALPRAQQLTFSETVTIPAAGYYRVVVSAVADSTESRFDSSGQPFQNSVYNELWLLVLPSGGRATAMFDVTAVPDSLVPTPGIARRKTKLRIRGGAAASISAPTHSSRTLTLGDPGVRQVTWYNPDDATYHPLISAKIHWTEYDPYQNITFNGGTLFTDSNGEFTEPCPSDNGGSYDNSMDGAISTEGFYSFVTWGSSSVITGWSGTPTSCLDASSSAWIVANSKQASVFTHAETMVAASQAAFGHSISSVEMRLDVTATNSYWNGSLIYLDTGEVLGPFGRFILSHEFGHTVHDLALGGIPPVTNCSAHGFETPSSITCAFVEGFGDYHAAVMEGPSNSSAAPLFTNGFFTSGSYTDGSTFESAMAALMLVVNDSIGMTRQQLGNTIRDCRLHVGSTNTKPLESDHLVYCLERTVDSTVKANYFSTSSSKPSSLTTLGPLASGWSSSNVRRLWLRTLYKQ
jgi:hypothetical protein